MGSSSIHVREVSIGSEGHNQRTTILEYVRVELSGENESFQIESIAAAKSRIEKTYQRVVGQKMQKKATPIREGVLLISKEHGIKDMKQLAKNIEDKFGIRTIQAYTHKDEGHYDLITKDWKPNYHAHMVFDWTDKNTGKTLKLDREDMSEMQTMVANTLGLERGVKSTKKHINSIKYKSLKEEQDLNKVYNIKNVLPDAIKVIQSSTTVKSEIKSLTEARNDLFMQIEELKKKELEEREIIKQERIALSEVQNAKSELEEKNKSLGQEVSLNKQNLDYLKDKTEEKRQELSKISTEIEQKQIRGFKR